MGANIRGQTRPGINGEILKAIFVPLPGQHEQREIVARIDASSDASALSAREATRALALLDHLEQSILARAFRGELVPQDPADAPPLVTPPHAAAGRSRRGRPSRHA